MLACWSTGLSKKGSSNAQQVLFDMVVCCLRCVIDFCSRCWSFDFP